MTINNTNKRGKQLKVFVHLVLSIVFILLFIGFVNAELYYSLDVYYDNGNIKIRNVDVVFSNEPLENIINEKYFKTYNLEVIDINRDKKEAIAFGVLNKFFYDSVNASGEIVLGGLQELENVSFIVYAPYHDTGKEIIIYDENGNKISEKDVSSFSKIIIEELGKEDGKEEEDSKVQEVKKSVFDIKKIINYKYLILGVILVILLLILIYLINQPSQLKKKR